MTVDGHCSHGHPQAPCPSGVVSGGGVRADEHAHAVSYAADRRRIFDTAAAMQDQHLLQCLSLVALRPSDRDTGEVVDRCVQRDNVSVLHVHVEQADLVRDLAAVGAGLVGHDDA